MNETIPLDMKIFKSATTSELNAGLSDVLEEYAYLFPDDRKARILLKPNLNSNMNAMTGNTTDLRLLSALIRYLQRKGYSNITIGEGTNSGFYRSRIGVISRLRVDGLARRYGVKVKDLNYAEPYEIRFQNGVEAQVAKDCLEADLFINLPKLKTHFEVGMSVCLKNMMGCLVGQENKKKTHDNLPENILRLNRQIRPHLHIVDGLVAMEGLGPTRGVPKRMDLIMAGTDPFLIDLVAARLAGFDYKKVRTLCLAEQKGMLTQAHHDYVNGLDLDRFSSVFAPPKAGPLANFIHSPKRQKHFLKIRNTPLFTYLASTRWFGHLLFLSGLRQDVFLQQEMRCEGLALRPDLCDGCGVCADLCPMGNDLPEAFSSENRACIHCLYCYSACPRAAIQFKGELGFFREQLRQYDQVVRALFSEGRNREHP